MTIPHKTYHHFVGHGTFDSNVDVIIHSSDAPYTEVLSDIFCIDDFPIMNSHHDIIMSSFSLPICDLERPSEDLVTAPRVDHSRLKIKWSEEGISEYQEELSDKLLKARLNWLNPSSKTSIAILLNLTHEILQKAASSTNTSIPLNVPHQPKSSNKPPELKHSENNLKRAHRKLKEARRNNINIAEKSQLHKESRKAYRATLRRLNHLADRKRDKDLHSILSSNPTAAYRCLKASKSSSSAKVPFLTVGSKKYVGEQVIDGMYESLSNLKSLDETQLQKSPYHDDLL